MINKEKFKKIVDLAYELEKLGADVFIHYSGHVETIDTRVYLKGWKEGTKPDYENSCYFDGRLLWGGEENIDDCINSLTEILNTKKESLDVERA